MRKRTRVTIGVLAVACAFLVVVMNIQGVGCGARTVLVTGRLIDAETGAPIGQAYIISLYSRELAADEGRIERHLAWVAEIAPYESEYLAKRDWEYCGFRSESTTTAADGTFEIVLSVNCTVSHRGPFEVSRHGYEPRGGAEVLRVEIAGRDPVLVDVPHGTWDEDRPEKGLAAVWSWGNVRVP